VSKALRGKLGRLREALRNQCGDCAEQPKPVAESGDANVLEAGVRQLRQQVRVDLVVPEIRLVLTETETAKPPADIHGRAPHGLAG
jgi:hypothetical protein